MRLFQLPTIFLVPFTSALPLVDSPAHIMSSALPNRVVAQFPPGTWIENVAVRANGNLILTSLMPNASVYEVINPTSDSTTVTRHFTVDRVGGLLGVTETTPEVFAFVGGNIDFSTGGVKGSWRVWTIDFTAGETPSLSLNSSMPDAILPNGVTILPQNRNILLIADSILGLVWRLDMNTGACNIAVQMPEMAAIVDGRPSTGINGLQIRDGYLFWTNDLKATLYKIKIDATGAPSYGSQPEIVGVLPSSRADDFIFGPVGQDITWVATNANNTVQAIRNNGEVSIIAGAANSQQVARATACQFGKTNIDTKILYVTTGGATIDGVTEGGKVVAIDTGGFL
jgi:hypothetical protein